MIVEIKHGDKMTEEIKTDEATTQNILQEEVKANAKKPKNKKNKWFLRVLLILVAVLGLGFFTFWYMNKNVIAKVGNDVITKNDLNKALYSQNFEGTINNPTRVSAEREKEIIGELVDNLIIKNKAKALGITVSDNELSAVIASRGMNTSAYTEEQKNIAKENTRTELLNNKFREEAFGWKSGDYLLFRFDKYLSNIANPNKEDKSSLTSEQKEYAKTLADSYYVKMKNKELDFTQAQLLLMNDPKIGSQALEPYTPSLSGSFGKEAYLQGLGILNTTTYPGFKTKVSSLANNALSEPFIVQDQGQDGKRDISYAVVITRDGNNGTLTGNFDSWLDQAKIDLKVKTYSNSTPFYKKIALVNKAYAVDCTKDNSTKQSPSTGELTNLNIYLKYKKADGTTAPVTKAMGVSFDFKSRQNKSGGYDNAQHSFISRPNPGTTSRNLCNIPMDRSDGLLNLEGAGGTDYRINCGYVKYIDVYYNKPSITNDSGNGTWDISDTPDSGQSDKRWIDFDQGASDGKITIRTFCWLHSNGKCNGDSSGGAKIHYPNGDKINFQMVYTPSYIKPSCSISADPSSVENGSSSTLSWTTANASSFKINNVSKTLNNSESTGALNMTTTYTGTVTGDGGNNTCSTTVNVSDTQTTYYWCPAGKFSPTVCSSGQYSSAAACSSANSGVTCTTSSACSCPAANISCQVAPTTGTSPLVVKVTSSPLGVLSPFTFRMNAGNFAGLGLIELTNKPAAFSYTYTQPGTYKVQIKRKDPMSLTPEWINCSPLEISVKSPTSSTGGEVAP